MNTHDGALLRALARGVAVLAAIGLVGLWSVTAWRAATGAGTPAGPTPTGPPAVLALAIFASLALAGGASALRGAPLVTVVAALVSFFPVGLWMLLVPGAGRWIGVLDLALLGAGLALLRLPSGDARPGPSSGSGQ